MIIMHVDIRFFLTKMLVLNKKTRQFLSSINSAMLDMFILSYGLNHRLRRTNLAGSAPLITFLSKLEKNMIRAEKEKDVANEAYLELV